MFQFCAATRRTAFGLSQARVLPSITASAFKLAPLRTPTIRHFTRTPLRFERSKPKNPPPSTPAKASDQPRLLDRLRAAGQLSDHAVPPVLTTSERLLKPFLFTLLVTGGSIYYGYTWTAPTPSTRMFPTVPQAFATVATIIALNATVFLAWRIPLPISWRLLNRYFISVPAIPNSFSLIGNVFSHQSFTHFGMNMFALYIFGTTLCEQIGSGWFVALYMSGGVVSSFGSLAYNVLRARFAVCALGASGAISAVVGAYAYINPENRLSVIFLPFLVLKAQTFVAVLACVEVLGLVRGWAMLDHMAHLGGLVWGTAFAHWLVGEMQKRREQAKRIYGWK